jgi:hypothetical protein
MSCSPDSTRLPLLINRIEGDICQLKAPQWWAARSLTGTAICWIASIHTVEAERSSTRDTRGSTGAHAFLRADLLAAQKRSVCLYTMDDPVLTKVWCGR